MPDEAGKHGIREHIDDNGGEVPLVLDHPGGEALAEQGSATAVAGVVLSRVVTLVPLNGAGEILGLAVHDGVVVRSHQAIGMEAKSEPLYRRPHERQEQQSVPRVPEEPRLVNAAGSHMEIPVRQM